MLICIFGNSWLHSSIMLHHRLEGLHWSQWNCGDFPRVQSVDYIRFFSPHGQYFTYSMPLSLYFCLSPSVNFHWSKIVRWEKIAHLLSNLT
uniref:Uncharacterized protein n=1 Tax=Arundo donax TaxID=35708 RepID=A0A0A9I767_ARUDO